MDKIIFTTQNSDDSDSDLQTGEFRDSVNLIQFSDNRSGFSRKNVAGTIKLTDFPVSSNAVCIGSEYYKPTNKAYFFFYDPTLGHSIIEFDFNNNVVTLLIRNALFNFSLLAPMHNISIVGDLLYFNDGSIVPSKINIAKAKADLYTGANFSEVAISQIRKQPIKPVEAFRNTDLLRPGNNPAIRKQKFQFALRYVYLDGETTVLSPVSRVVPICRDTTANVSYNKIDLYLYIDKDIKPFLDRIELCVRYGNTGGWFIYDKILPSAFTIAANDPITGYNRLIFYYKFYNDKSGPSLSDEEALPLYQSFPSKSDTFELFQDRIFAVATEEDYDLEETEWDAAVQVSNNTSLPGLQAMVNDVVPKPDSLLGRSRYGAGLVFFDKFGKRSSVGVKPGLFFNTPDNITYPAYGSQILYSLCSSITAEIQATGKPPVWAYWVQPVRTNNLSFSWWHAAKCRVQFPKTTKKTTKLQADVLPEDDYYIEDEYEYFKVQAQLEDMTLGAETDFPASFSSYFDITIPDNFPFTIDEKTKVRLTFNHPDSANVFNVNWDIDQASILERIGNKIRIKNPVPGKINWKNIYYTNAAKYSGINLQTNTVDPFTALDWLFNNEVYLHLQFFQPKDELSDPIYFEVGELIPIQNPGTPSRSFPLTMPIHGDCYNQGYRYEDPGVLGSSTSLGADKLPHSLDWNFTTDDYTKRVGFPSMSAYASERGQVFLNGIDTDQGKPNLPINSTDVQFNGNVVRWTDTYTSGSVYNGLGVMRNANKFAVASERGFIKKLVASNDNTLLAIHARTMTSLYVGMRMLKSPTGQESIVQSDDVIGYQRPLSTELGTINPESVVSVNNYQVYGFDLNAGEPWRKSNDGVEPLATRYKMKKWFKAKADELKRASAIDPSVVIKIIGAFDPYFQTFFLTFQEVSYVEDSITKIIPAVTIGFSELLKGFVGRFRFTQENYTNLGNSMVSVRNQKLWEHNKDLENHNKFADVQYDSEITIVCKVQDDYEKIWNNIAQSSNMPWSVTKITTPSGQETDMPIENFTQRDGIYYVDILRDKNTPSALLKPSQSPRLHGVEMIGQTCTITLLNSDKKEVILDAIYVGFTPVAGHLLNMK